MPPTRNGITKTTPKIPPSEINQIAPTNTPAARIRRLNNEINHPVPLVKKLGGCEYAEFEGCCGFGDSPTSKS
jgi:hypothetical protein